MHPVRRQRGGVAAVRVRTQTAPKVGFLIMLAFALANAGVSTAPVPPRRARALLPRILAANVDASVGRKTLYARNRTRLLQICGSLNRPMLILASTCALFALFPLLSTLGAYNIS